MIYRDQIYDFTEKYIKKYSTLFEGNMSLDDQKKIAGYELGEKFILEPKEASRLEKRRKQANWQAIVSQIGKRNKRRKTIMAKEAHV